MRFVTIAALALAVLVLLQAPAAAQVAEAPAETDIRERIDYPFSDLRVFTAGFVIIGAALGIGMLARAAVESIARQQEMAANIQTAMIIAAALIEGVTLFALIIILLSIL